MTSNSDQNGDSKDYEVFYIGNIPPQFHSADLRAFFSQLVEDDGFECFHYRHRPEHQSKKIDENKTNGDNISEMTNIEDIAQSETSSVVKPNSTCCIVKVRNNKLTTFKPYSRSQWCDRKGVYYPKRVLIASLNDIKSIHKSEDGSQPNDNPLYLSKKEKREKAIQKNNLELTTNDINNLIEMDPPPAMPQGNVGTPLKHFMTLIKQCRLPISVIKKLDLKFPKSFSKRKYGSVPYNYLTAAGIYNVNVEDEDNISSDKTNSDPDDDVPNDSDFKDEHGDAEDWERHEALHDDVGTQERTKERLFEEDLEVKWEKGGSGLVFYTDAYFWHEQKGKDFDEDTTDDWDVDMGIYYGEGGDFDSEQLHEMRVEKKMRKDGVDRRIGFEKFTKGFGSNQLYKHGWKTGKGVGSWTEGISEPVEANGQHPRDKTGLGFHVKRKRRAPTQRRSTENDVYIATVYDKRNNDNDEDVLERREGPYDIKYKTSIIKKFVKAKKS